MINDRIGSVGMVISSGHLFVVIADDFCYFVIVIVVDRCDTRSAKTARSSTPQVATAWTRISTTTMKWNFTPAQVVTLSFLGCSGQYL